MVEVLGKVYSPASAPPRPNTTVVHGHASVRHQPGCLVPLSDALGLRSVVVVRIEAVEVRAHRRLAGEAVALLVRPRAL